MLFWEDSDSAEVLRRKQKTNITKQHLLVTAIAITRLISSLNHSGSLGGEIPTAVAGLIISLPYAFEFYTFVLLASGWAVLVHHTWDKDAGALLLRRLTFATACGAALTIALVPFFFLFFGLVLLFSFVRSLDSPAPLFESVFQFVGVGVTKSRVLAIIGAALLAFMMYLVAGFFVRYATKLVSNMNQNRSARSLSSGGAGGSKAPASLERRLQVIGRGVAICLAIEATFSLVAIAVEEKASSSENDAILIAMTVLFLLFNCAALVLLLYGYHAAVMKATQGGGGLRR